MKMIIQKQWNRAISSQTEERIFIVRGGAYVIEIAESAKSWWQNALELREFFKKDSLTVRIDDQEIVPQKKKLHADDIWNGNVLKGNDLTTYIFAYLDAGQHTLSFTVQGKPLLDHVTVFAFDQKFFGNYSPFSNDLLK
jgi:hypothetical protein